MAFFDGFLDKAGSFLGDVAMGMDAGFNGGKIQLSDGQTSPSTGGYLGALLAGFDPMIQQNAIQSHANKIYAGGNQQAGDNYVQQENQAQALINDRMKRIYERRKLEDKTRALRSFAKNINGGNDPVIGMLKQYADLNPEAGASALATYVMQNQDPDAVLARKLAQNKQNILSGIPQILGGGSPGITTPTAAPAVLAPTVDPMEALRSINGDVMSTLGTSVAPSQAPLSVRNNNPGNIRGRDGQFAMYDSPEAGMAAMTNDLGLKINGRSPIMQERFGPNYTPTLSNVISTWAPPSENDTGAYIRSVAQQIGIDPNRPLSESDLAAIVPAMIRQEGGSAASQYYSAPAPQNAPATSQTAPVAPQSMPSSPADTELARIRQIQDYLEPYASVDKDIKDQLDYYNEREKSILEQTVKGVEGESALRKEFDALPDVKEFRVQERAYQAIKAGAKDLSGPGGIATIFNFMKSLDPASTVREGEYATAQNAGGIPTWLRNIWNKAQDGNAVTPELRDQFLNQAYEQYQAANQLFTSRVDQYRGFASDYGFNPDRVAKGPRLKITPPEKLAAQAVKAEAKKAAPANVIQDLTNKYGLIK